MRTRTCSPSSERALIRIVDLRCAAFRRISCVLLLNMLSLGAASSDATTLRLTELTNGASSSALHCVSPFASVTNRIPSNFVANAAGRRIPRYVHLSWVAATKYADESNRTRCIHERHWHAVRAWQQALPRYAVFFHDDAAVSQLFAQEWPEFPRLHEALACVMYKGAMLIDLWRILVVYRYGGLYSDIDVWPTAAFTEEALIQPDDQAFFLSDAWTRPSQWLFAMEPRHPVAYAVMHTILNNILALKDVMSPKLVFTTGPMAFKNGYVAAMNRTSSATSPPSPSVFREGVHWNIVRGRNFTVRKVGGRQNKFVTTMNASDKKQLETDIPGWQPWSKIFYKASRAPTNKDRHRSCDRVLRDLGVSAAARGSTGDMALSEPKRPVAIRERDVARREARVTQREAQLAQREAQLLAAERAAQRVHGGLSPHGYGVLDVPQPATNGSEAQDPSLRRAAQQLLRDLSRPSAVCKRRLRRIGARDDGGYVVCGDLPPLSGSDCLVYSFGIRGEFTLENQLQARGCSVHGYDPTVVQTPKMRFNFTKLGLSDSRKTLPRVGPVTTLSEILRANGHEARPLSLLKIDIEGSEWDALEQILTDGDTPTRVPHLAIEVHLGCHKCPTAINRVGLNGRDEEWLRFFQPRLRRLLAHFDLYHAYANTCDCRGARLISGVTVPPIWELAFAKKGLLVPLPPDAPSYTNRYGDAIDGRTCRYRRSCECTCRSADATSCGCGARIQNSSTSWQRT